MGPAAGCTPMIMIPYGGGVNRYAAFPAQWAGERPEPPAAGSGADMCLQSGQALFFLMDLIEAVREGDHADEDGQTELDHEIDDPADQGGG